MLFSYKQNDKHVYCFCLEFSKFNVLFKPSMHYIGQVSASASRLLILVIPTILSISHACILMQMHRISADHVNVLAWFCRKLYVVNKTSYTKAQYVAFIVFARLMAKNISFRLGQDSSFININYFIMKGFSKIKIIPPILLRKKIWQ